VRHAEARRWAITGDLTVKGTTREIVLDTSFEGVVMPPPQFGSLRARMAFRARAAFDRRDFGLDHNTPLPGGGWLVGNRVGVRIDVEATLA
jgi:polyisoprenoid-binding protein YceI